MGPINGEEVDQYGLTESDRNALRALAKEEAEECMQLIHGDKWKLSPGLVQKAKELECRKYKEMAEPGFLL